MSNPLFVGRHLITKDDCPKCERVKKIIPPDVIVHNAKDREGMTLMAWFEAKYDEFPILTEGQDVKVSGVINIMRHLSQSHGITERCEGEINTRAGDEITANPPLAQCRRSPTVERLHCEQAVAGSSPADGSITCPKCGGMGGSPTGDSRCDACDGSGKFPERCPKCDIVFTDWEWGHPITDRCPHCGETLRKVLTPEEMATRVCLGCGNTHPKHLVTVAGEQVCDLCMSREFAMCLGLIEKDEEYIARERATAEEWKKRMQGGNGSGNQRSDG